MSERPPEWICGKRVSIRASMRWTSRRFVTEALVDMAARPTFVIWHHYETFLSFPPVSQNRKPEDDPHAALAPTDVRGHGGRRPHALQRGCYRAKCGQADQAHRQTDRRVHLGAEGH